MKQRSPAFLLLSLIILIGAATVMYRAMRLTIADFEFMRPRATLDRWQQGIQPNNLVWSKMRAQLESLQTSIPNDPQLAEAQGYLYGLQAVQLKALPELYEIYLRDSLPYFERATRLRPMSPYAWGNIAFALFELKETDDPRFQEAYDRALRYGQREYSVQNQLVSMSILRWSELTPEQKIIVGKIVSTMSGKRREMATQLADQEGIWNLVPLEETTE